MDTRAFLNTWLLVSARGYVLDKISVIVVDK
jgi:hypothetical protein